MTQTPIRVGIAGLGRSGWDIHAHLLEPLGSQFQVVAVVDADPARREEAVERFDCQAYDSYTDLLQDQAVELVVVALPSFVHAQAAIDALAAGKHVVCEKPMATSLPDAERMVAAAEASDKVLTIFQQRRYSPDFVKVKEIIDSGRLGRIVQVRITESRFGRRWDWQTLQKFGGGSLNNTGPHFLDQALQLFGEHEIGEVFCHLDRTLTLGDADDHVKLVIKGPAAPTIDIEISSCHAYPAETWNVMGTRGGLSGSTRQLRWKWLVDAEMAPRELDIRPTPNRSYNRDELVWHEDSWEVDSTMSTFATSFYTDLYGAIREGKPLAITPQSVRRVIWLQEECHRLSPLTQEVF
ncbi:MAG: Gfo/Idh/MocA family oxidoreductase [Caldilineaceae bacterium]|nr:Gfo/Idh/MocA family oxidoreductase [Caldilineaceae bacterium]